MEQKAQVPDTALEIDGEIANLGMLCTSLAALGLALARGPAPRLWNTGVWPWAQRPWIALLEKGVPFRHELIDLSDKPAEFRALYATARGSAAKVPLLELGEAGEAEAVVESLDIIRRIASEWAGTGTDLAAGARHVEPFIELWTGRVEPAYYELLSAPSEPDARAARAGLIDSLAAVEESLWQRRLESRWQEGEGDFLLGAQFSLAEVAAAPWVERMRLMLPHWRAVDVGALCAQQGLGRTAAWLDAVASRPSVVASSAGADEMIAASRRYYVSHVSPGAPGTL